MPLLSDDILIHFESSTWAWCVGQPVVKGLNVYSGSNIILLYVNCSISRITNKIFMGKDS